MIGGIKEYCQKRKIFKEYLSGYELFDGKTIDFQYVLLNINKYTDDELVNIRSLLSSVFLLDKKQNVAVLIKNLETVAKSLSGMSRDEQIDILDWIKDALVKKVKYSRKEQINGLMEKFAK